nr:MAG TPA: hypothetical protein [Caudoviricetes sp.]
MAVCRFLSLASIPIYSFSTVTDNQFRMGDRTVPYPRCRLGCLSEVPGSRLVANQSCGQRPPFRRKVFQRQCGRARGNLFLWVGGHAVGLSGFRVLEYVVVLNREILVYQSGIEAGHALFFGDPGLHGGVQRLVVCELRPLFPLHHVPASAVRHTLFLHQDTGAGKIIQQAHIIPPILRHAFRRLLNTSCQPTVTPLELVALLYEYPPKLSLVYGPGAPFFSFHAAISSARAITAFGTASTHTAPVKVSPVMSFAGYWWSPSLKTDPTTRKYCPSCRKGSVSRPSCTMNSPEWMPSGTKNQLFRCRKTSSSITPPSYQVDFVTVTVYTFCAEPFFTVMVRVLVPSAQVAAAPLLTGVSPFRMVTVALSSSGVAVTVFVALVVVAVYSVVSGSNVGLSVSAPIVSPERRAVNPPPKQ